MPFGILNGGGATRFAGDLFNNISNNVGKAYTGFDNQLGGILPGGSAPSAQNLAGEIFRDALPGDRKVTGAAIAKKANAASGDVTEGNLVGASSGLHGGKAGAEVREQVVEEARDAIISKVGQKALSGPLRTGAGLIAPPVMIADRFNDAKDAYSTYLDIRTGQDLDQHMQVAADKRDPLYGVSKPGTYVATADGSTPTLEQRDRVPRVFQDINNRVQLVRENFNPLVGDWGLTEGLYGK